MTKKIEKKSSRSHQGQKLSALWLCFLMLVIGYLAASWFDINQCISWVSAHFTDHHQTGKLITKKTEDNVTSPDLHPKLEFYTLLTNDAGLSVPTAEKMHDSENTADLHYKSIPEKITTPSSTLTNTGPMELAVTAPVPIPASVVPARVSQPAVVKRPEPTRMLPKPAESLPKPVYAPNQSRVQGRFAIQVGSFRSPMEAKRMRDKLASKGYSAQIISVNQQSLYWYRVMVGPFSSLGQAQQIQNNLSRRERINGMIRKIDG